MRGLFWLLALFATAVGVSLLMRFNEAYVLVVLPPWRVEVSLNFAVVALVALLFLFHFAMRAITLTYSLPAQVRKYREERRKEKATTLFEDAIRLLLEGRFGHALNKASQAHEAGEARGLSALIAARAAQRMRETDKQLTWLARATQDDKHTKAARLMLEAEMLLDVRRFRDAATVLAQLQKTSGRHIAALRLELRAQQGLANWSEVLRIARQLEKRNALVAEAANEVKTLAHCEQLSRRASDAAELMKYLHDIPSAEFSLRITRDASQHLLALGKHEEVRHLIEKQLECEWDSDLAIRYSFVDGDTTQRIARAEAWLNEHPRDAALLLTLGRLCIQQKLWGKAQSFLDAALSVSAIVGDVHIMRETRLLLAGLSEQLGKYDDANVHYQVAAKLAAR